MITPILNLNLRSIKIPFTSTVRKPPISVPEPVQDTFEIQNNDMESAKTELGKKLLKLEDVHCPVCGAKMLNKEQFQNLLEEAEDVSTPEQYYELLKENEKYLKSSTREVVSSAKQIIEENPNCSYKTFLKKMVENGNLKFRSALGDSIEYMNKNLEELPLRDEDQRLINKFINKLSAYQDSAWPYYKLSEVVNIMNSTLSILNTDERERFYRHISNSMFAASTYNRMLMFSDIDNKSDKENSFDAFYKMFFPSVAEATKILDGVTDRSEPYNVILLCNTCMHNRDKRDTFFPKSSDLRKVGYRSGAYLEDVTQAIGSNKLDASPVYIFGGTTLINYATKGKVSFSPERLKEQVRHVNFIRTRPEFLPAELDEEIPCSACGTTMVMNSKKRDLGLDLQDAKTPKDIVKILNDNKKYIHPELEDFVDLINGLIEDNPNISSDDIMVNLKVTATRDTDRYLRKIVNLCRKKVAAGCGTPGQRSKVLEFADNVENWRLKNPKITYFVYKDYYDYFKDTCLLEKSGPFRMKGFAHTRFRQVVAKNNLVFQGPITIERFDGNELKGFVETLFRMSGFTMDHYLPKSSGGSNNIENLTGMCRLCNSNKSNLSPDVWLKQMPSAKVHTLRNLERMEEIIEDGKLPGYEDYPAKSAKYLYEITNGKVDYRERFPLNKKETD